jgi:hypothetical protein
MKFGIISPQDWGLQVAEASSKEPIPALNISPFDLEKRVYNCTYHWAQRHFDEEVGAFYGFYSAIDKRFEPPQTVNLIAPWQFLAAYDRYQDEDLLIKACQATDWFYDHFVVTHPMSVVIGGVAESLPDGELWTKFAAEFVILCLGLYARTGNELYFDRAKQSAGFLVQSTRYSFRPKYNTGLDSWRETGWQSFGRVVEAFLLLADATDEPKWKDFALKWGEYGLTLQADDGGFFLIDGDYFNTDIAADELRALVVLHEQTQSPKYLNAAGRFANWLVARQREDGSWPLTIDRDDNIIVPTAGPGDIPNIAIAFLRLHYVTNHTIYLDAACRALRYSLAMQIIPDSDHPHSNDPNVQWGFWSWCPYYDYTVSCDQATHHIRGFLFALDYLQRSDHAGSSGPKL